ncbi:hypothetical protein Ciccas_004804 [Cichlidogyrus casuarinus]|uniref:Uncharacterized protein n=1 Tax=Cichlidogyrus casuarinus TaxID=1844966 RepID=A0ABD2QAG7_9PLAT
MIELSNSGQTERALHVHCKKALRYANICQGYYETQKGVLSDTPKCGRKMRLEDARESPALCKSPYLRFCASGRTILPQLKSACSLPIIQFISPPPPPLGAKVDLQLRQL